MKKLGFTLLECMIVILILIVLSSIALPIFKTHQTKSAKEVSKLLMQHLELAKSAAIAHQSVVTVCGSRDGLACDNAWSDGYLIFHDKKRNGVKEASDKVIAFKRLEDAVLTVQWRGFISKKFLQFSSNTFLNAQNGSFIICDNLGNNQKLILNSTGRIRSESIASCRS